MSDYEGDLITLIELDQPFCNLEYGTAPCQAELGVDSDAKCHNTRETCADPDNYDPGTLTLTFSKQQEGIHEYGNVIPSVQSVNLTPMTLNLAGMDSDMSPFGRRESVQIQFADHLYSDLLVDKYRLEREDGTAGTAYDPYESGTFWGTFLARNPYHEGYALRVRQGQVGDTLAEMQTRHYIIDRISGPADGSVKLTAKDLFSKVEDRKAKAPTATRGELLNGFDEQHAGDITMIPVGIGDLDYPTGEFHVAVGKEAIRVTRSAGSDVLAIQERAALGSELEDHDGSDKVQLVLVYDSERAHDIVEDLLTEYAGVPASAIPSSEWDSEMTDRPERLTAYIAEPTPVEDLVGELAEQIGFTLWPDVVANEIKIKVLSLPETITPTVDDDAWMIEGSYSSKRMIKERVSQVWVYYGQRSPLESQDDPANYHSRRVFADLDAETDEFYGTASIRSVFSRWIPQYAGTFAATAGSRILSIFRDPPRRASFQLHRSKADELSFAEPFLLHTRDEQDALGQIDDKQMVPIELVRDQDRVSVLCQQLRFFSPAPEERIVTIESDTNNVNARTLFDSLFGDPAPGDEVIVRVLQNVTVGSDSPGDPSLRTGSWIEGVDLTLELQSGARILGAGGDGGDNNGGDGEDGGTALLAEYGTTIDNGGTIAGGGGGGGGAKDESDPLLAQAEGGGGAGVEAGTGHENGDDTTGGEGGFAQDSTGGVEPITATADAGNGGDLGQPGQPGSTVLTPDGAGEPGKAGVSIDGGASVSFDTEGTIIGDVKVSETTTLDPPAATLTGLTLSSQLILVSTSDYSISLILSFDDPDDTRIVSYEAQYRLTRHDGAWQALYNALERRWEWQTAEIGQFQVRVRAVYAGQVTGPWTYATETNLGTYDALTTVGLNDPIDPLLFITTNDDNAQADIRIESGYDDDGGAAPDRFFIFYSVAENPAQMTITDDDGSRIYLNADESVTSTFLMTVDSGSTTTRIQYDKPPEIDVNTVGGWWIAIQKQGQSALTRYYKVSQASDTELVLSPGNELPEAPAAGDTIHVAELDWADGRLAEFKLAWIDGEVVQHDGIQFDDSDSAYYLAVSERGTEGTTQASHSAGDLLDYYPAPGPLTHIVEVPASEFRVVDGVFTFSGTIPVQIPPNMGWASVTCAVARKASDDQSALFVRSNIVPLTIAGPV